MMTYVFNFNGFWIEWKMYFMAHIVWVKALRIFGLNIPIERFELSIKSLLFLTFIEFFGYFQTQEESVAMGNLPSKSNWDDQWRHFGDFENIFWPRIATDALLSKRKTE